MTVNYDLCLSIALEILDKVKEDHPKMRGAITMKNLMDFLDEEKTILQPRRNTIYSEKRYMKLYNRLADVKYKLFYKRLIK